MATKQPGRPVIKIAVASTDWSRSVVDGRGWPVMGGAGWIRFGQWARYSGNHVIVGELIDNGFALGSRTFDNQSHINPPVLVMQRVMDAGVSRKVRRSVGNGQKVINDVDDWFWDIHPENLASKAVNPEHNPDRNIHHYKETLQESTFVTASTPFLAEALSQWGIKTHVIENRVSVHLFPVRRHRNAKPIIGWVGSTGHRSGDLKLLRKPFAAMAGSVFFHHTGEHPAHARFADETGVDPSDLSTFPMLAPSEYVHGFRFDIGVVPLTENDFNRAKSWIKGLEYAAAGVPFVASPLPEYVRLKEEFGIGRLASTPDEWVHHLTELLDHEVRAEESVRQRALVEEHFPVRRMAREWDEVVWQ